MPSSNRSRQPKIHNIFATLYPLKVFASIQIILSIVAFVCLICFYVIVPIALIIISIILVIPLLVLLAIDSQDPFAPIWNNFGFPTFLKLPMLCIVWPTFFLSSIFTGVVLFKGVKKTSRLHLHIWTMYALVSILLFVYQGFLIFINLMELKQTSQNETDSHVNIDINMDIAIITTCSILTVIYMYFIVFVQICCCKIKKLNEIPIEVQPSYNSHYFPQEEQQHFELFNLAPGH